MVEALQLPLPEPPFDFEKDELLDISVELCADRLKGTVAWLVECIREQQQLLESHEVRLCNISTARSVDGDEKSRPSSRTKSGDDVEEKSEKSRPPSRVTIADEPDRDDEGEKSPPAPRLRTPPYTSSEVETSPVDSPKTSSRSPKPRLHKSVTQGLQDSMKDELLSMKVTKLQLELNTLPTRADLAGQREEIGAEMNSLADNVNANVLKEKDAVRSELAQLTEDMYSRLQRICDDVMKRLEDVESMTARTDETSVELKACINRINVHLESQLAANASINVPIQQPNSDDDSVAETVTTVRRTVPNESDKITEARTSDMPPGSRNSLKSQGDPRLGTEEKAPTTAPTIERERTAIVRSFTDARLRDDCNSVAYSETDHHHHHPAHVNAVVTDPSIFDFASQISNLANLVERNHQICRKVENKTADLQGTTRTLGEQSNTNEEKLKGLEAEIDEIKEALSSLGDPASTLDTMRKEWLGKAACRGDSRSDDGDPTANRLVRQRTFKESTDGNVLGRIRPTSSESATGSLSKMMSEFNAEMDDVHMVLDGVPAQIEELQQAIAKMNGMPSQIEELLQAVARMKSLEDTVSECREILLPMDQPDLGTVVSTFTKRIDDLENWKIATDKRIRRMNPLDSEFADVQNELERLRKLFEFIQQVLPSDAAQAMNFFSKSFSRPPSGNASKAGKVITKDLGSKSMAKQHMPLIDSVATSLGPEVAFEMQRAKLEEEVRQHEKAMRQEFANLTTAIKSLQREMQQTSGKTVDLGERVARCEGGVAPGLAGQEQPQSEEVVPCSSSRGENPESSRGSLKLAQHEPGGSDESNPYVSKGAMQQALKETREDFRNWLDEWSANFLSALQKKADSNQVAILLKELQQAIGSSGLTSDTVALIAKRALLGRCASCDTNLNVDMDNLKRNPPVPKTNAYPNRPPAGAPVTMRPPGVSQMPQVLLPKILDSRKDFPKGKIFKTPSAPDIRQVRTPDQSEENIQ